MGRTTRRWVRPSSRPVVDRSSAVGMHLLLLAAVEIADRRQFAGQFAVALAPFPAQVAWLQGDIGGLDDEVTALEAKVTTLEGENAARMVNNLDWTAPLSAIDFLRDIGKYYRVGTMLKKDAVSARLNSEAHTQDTMMFRQPLAHVRRQQIHRSAAAAFEIIHRNDPPDSLARVMSSRNALPSVNILNQRFLHDRL